MDRILFYRGGTCNEARVEDNLKKIVQNVYVLSEPCRNNDLDPELAQKLFELIHKNRTEALMSLDYYPIIAEVAHISGIPYISWILDAPHSTLYSSTSLYDSSYIFHFDREEALRLISMGRPNVFHLTLASDPGYFGRVIRSAPGYEKFEVSFLGSSYQNEKEEDKGFSEYERGFLEGLMKVQREVYGVSVIGQSLSEEMQNAIINAYELKWPETYDLPRELVAEKTIEKRVSVRDRKEMVERMAGRFGITLFSGTEDLKIKGVSFKGYADYETVMPCVFAGSRINLNPTLRNIHSGIPLRAMDIMACGGFLMSNYQPELAEYFEEGVSAAMYGSMDELVEKTGWYLDHEDIRRSVAQKGYETVCARFTYEKKLKEILETVEKGG